MASRLTTLKFLFVVLSSFTIAQMALAGDADITSDFLVPLDMNIDINGNFFTYTGMRALVDGDFPTNFTVTKASMVEFPALNAQIVSYAALQFPASSTNPPHTHPCFAELLFLIVGTLEVGFVDTTNKLFTQSLQASDMFVFPKGTVSLLKTLFATDIDDNILAKSFKTDVATIQPLKSGLASK
ncbi:hypothetical protein PTKIN_Ptkin11bG0061900 [Pterospermum kingtungense]